LHPIDIENYKKTLYTLSTVAYPGSYLITDSILKSAAITHAMGITKEFVYDELLGKGTPMWEGMRGDARIVFTVLLRF